MKHPYSDGNAPSPKLTIPGRGTLIGTDFSREPFIVDHAAAGRIEHDVYTIGAATDPGILLLHELPGLSWQCVRVARLLAAAHFRVYVPHLFGTVDGEGTSVLAGVANILRLCVSREIHLFAANDNCPITVWLRTLGLRIRSDCNGTGVGVIGMCLTGNFALSLLLEELNAAPVICQPAIPFWPAPASAIGFPESDLRVMRGRVAASALPVRAYRFERDKKCPAQRLERLEQEFPTLLRWELKGDLHATITSALGTGKESASVLEDIISFMDEHLRR